MRYGPFRANQPRTSGNAEDLRRSQAADHRTRTSIEITMRILGALAGMLCLGVAAATAQSPETIFQQANQLHQQGKVAEARDQYESILKNGCVSGDLYFNLGNAYYKS